MIEMKRAMLMAQDEIQRLRHQNEILAAKVEVIELFGLVFRTQPNYQTMDMSEDPVWLLQKQLDALEKGKEAA